MENQLNRKIKQFVFEELRKTPNIESIDSVLQAIEAFLTLLSPGGGAQRPPLYVFAYCS